MKKFFKNNKGFTLIELLVVIAILAVLATLYVPRIMGSAADAKKTVEIANARTLASEITMFNSTAEADDKIMGTTAVPASNSKLRTNLGSGDFKVLESNDGKLSASGLIAGRSFPDPEIVELIVDKDGNCFIVQGTKAGATEGDDEGKPF